MEENKMGDKDLFVLKRELVERGSGLALQIPKDILEYLSLEKGDKVGILPENGKHGRYIAIWKLSEQEGDHESDIQSE